MIWTRHNSPGSTRGFTLLELLIATAVGATVLLVIHTTFFSALRLYNGTHDSLDENRMVERTLAIVRRDLSGILVPGGVLSGQLQSANFSSLVQETAGDRVSPDLYTSTGRVDGWTPFADVQMVAYYLAPSSDGGNSRSLVRAVTRNLLPTQTETPDEQILMTGVASAAVSFYDGSGWTEEWDSTVTSSLPTAIRFSLVLATRPGEPESAPIELVVPVLAATTTQLQEASSTTGS